jgi:hypothetical protein
MKLRIEWGKITTDTGKEYKDCVVTQDGACSWNWALDGTKHIPGITLAAIFLIENCDVLILSTGMQNRLKISSEALAYLKYIDKPYYILQSQEAVKKFNQYDRSSTIPGLLLHSTC